MTKIIYTTLSFFLLFNLLGAQEIRLHSVTKARETGGDSGYTLDGGRMNGSARPKLENPDYFSESGIYPKYVSITDAYGKMGSLEELTAIGDEVDLFFFGAFNKLDNAYVAITQAEMDSLYAWSQRGGKLIIGAGGSLPQFGYDPGILNETWGFEIHPGLNEEIAVLPTPQSQGSGLFSGHFGEVQEAFQGGALQGYFTEVPEPSSVLATDTEGHPVIIMDCNTYDLILAEVDIFTDLSGLSNGPEAVNDNDRLWLNAITFMDELQTTVAVTQAGNALSAGTNHLSYQWLLEGQPIAGATDSTLTIAEDGNYSVSVTLPCGCPATSADFPAVLSGAADRLPDVTWSVSPNPATDFISVQVKAAQSTDFVLLVQDALGRLVERRMFERVSDFSASVAVGHLPAGVYSLTLNTEEGAVSKRLVKR